MLKNKVFLFVILLSLLSTTVIFSGCDIVTGSGQTQTFEMDYKDFTRIEIATGFDVTVTRADSFFVSITIDKSLYEYLTLGQRGDTLLIGLKSNRTYTAAQREATINLPDLRRLQLSGNSKATVSGFSETHAVDFDVSGASALTLSPTQTGDASFIESGGSQISGDIEMAKGNFNISGGSTLELDRHRTGIKVSAAGGSTVTLDKLPVSTADIVLSGGSQATINVSDLMDVNLSGGSGLEYIGNPRLGSLKMSGGSTLNQIQ